MKTTLDTADLKAVLLRVAKDVVAEAELLRELDAAIGDGDLGITMTIGMAAAEETLATLDESDMSALLMKPGMAFNRKAASTFGALYATMMMRMARAVKGKTTLTLNCLVEMADAAVTGVMDRGKAQPGDKTMLDAMVPARDALREAASSGAGLSEALADAANAAEQGALGTKEMVSQAGRSRWFAERTQGAQDPGATAIWLMLRSAAAAVAEMG